MFLEMEKRMMKELKEVRAEVKEVVRAELKEVRAELKEVKSELKVLSNKVTKISKQVTNLSDVVTDQSYKLTNLSDKVTKESKKNHDNFVYLRNLVDFQFEITARWKIGKDEGTKFSNLYLFKSFKDFETYFDEVLNTEVKKKIFNEASKFSSLEDVIRSKIVF